MFGYRISQTVDNDFAVGKDAVRKRLVVVAPRMGSRSRWPLSRTRFCASLQETSNMMLGMVNYAEDNDPPVTDPDDVITIGSNTVLILA